MTTKTAGLLFDQGSKEKEITKNERVLIYEDSKLIEKQKGIMERLVSSLNMLRKEYAKLKIGDPTKGELQLLISLSDETDNESFEKVRDFILSRPALKEKTIKAGDYTIKYSKAVQQGLIEVPEINNLYNMAKSVRTSLLHHSNEGYSYSQVDYVNGEFVVNMNSWIALNQVYISSEKDKERCAAFESVASSINSLINQGYTNANVFNEIDRRWFTREENTYRPNYRLLFS